MNDLTTLSATEARHLIAAKKLSPVELIDAALARIEQVQPALNPFCFSFPEAARLQAKAAEAALMRGDARGALHGLPVAFKDLTPTQGHRTTRGSYCFEHWVSDADPVIVRRFKAAGAILVGKTTTPEFAHSSFTRSPLWGHTRNPWNPDRTSGGSSGGSAVAVATGCVALAEGTDMGGSVRIPAAACGIVGLKPSLGRIPMDILDTSFDNISHFGPLARTVEDAALFLSVAEGPDDADIQSQCSPTALTRPVSGDVAGLRIAMSPDLAIYEVDPTVIANLETVADTLRQAGAVVEPVSPAWTAEMVAAWLDLWAVFMAASFGHFLDHYRDRMDPELVELIEHGQAMSAADYRRIDFLRTRQWHALAQFFERFDALICPTLSRGAPPVDAVDPPFEGRDGAKLRTFDMTGAFNLVAQCPVISVPSGVTQDGLPTGCQVVGRRFDDPMVLRIARAVEIARPWPLWSLQAA